MQLLKGPRKSVHAVAFSPDGRWLVGGGSGVVRLWDLSTGTLAHSWPVEHWGYRPAFSPDSRLVAVIDHRVQSREPSTLIVWRASTPDRPLYQGPGPSAANTVWFDAAGRYAYACSFNSELMRWDTSDWRSARLWQDRPDWGDPGYSHILPSPDRKYLFRQGDQNVGPGPRVQMVEQHDLAAGTLARAVRLPDDPRREAVTADNRLFVYTHDNKLVVIDLETGKEVGRGRSPRRKRIESLAVSPDGRRAFTSQDENMVRIWTGPPWAPVEALDFGVGVVTSLAVAADGQRAAAGGGSGSVAVWDVD